MSLLLREKLEISSIFPLQKGGSRTPSNSKYLLSNSIGVLGVSASLSAIVQRTDTEDGADGAAGWTLRGRLQPIRRGISDVMRAHEAQHQDHFGAQKLSLPTSTRPNRLSVSRPAPQV